MADKFIGSMLTLPSVANSNRFSPPKAAAYWSCLPIGDPNNSISTKLASSASCTGLAFSFFNVCKALSKATAKLLEEPRPEFAGKSADVEI